MSVSSLCKGRLVVVIAVRLVGFGGGRAMTSDAVLRGARALTLPSVLFTSGLAGHVAAGGVTPAASALVPLFVLTVLAVAAFAMAPISPARAVVLMVGGQGLLHAVLHRHGHDNHVWHRFWCGRGVLAERFSPDDAFGRSGTAWFRDAVDDRRAPDHAVRASGCGGRGWGMAGGRGAGFRHGAGTRCATGRQCVADGRCRGPRRPRWRGCQLSTPSAWLEPTVSSPWLGVGSGLRLPPRPT
jgi:hypothetical protein